MSRSTARVEYNEAQERFLLCNDLPSQTSSKHWRVIARGLTWKRAHEFVDSCSPCKGKTVKDIERAYEIFNYEPIQASK